MDSENLDELKSLCGQLRAEKRWVLFHLTRFVRCYRRGIINMAELRSQVCSHLLESDYEYQKAIKNGVPAEKQSPHDLASEFVQLGREHFPEVITLIGDYVEGVSEEELQQYEQLPPKLFRLFGPVELSEQELIWEAQRAELRFVQILRPILREQ